MPERRFWFEAWGVSLLAGVTLDATLDAADVKTDRAEEKLREKETGEVAAGLLGDRE